MISASFWGSRMALSSAFSFLVIVLSSVKKLLRYDTISQTPYII
nr:MAG TPA: hypothetical protein [Caudoviricetes sp.]DAZ67831.1 MAG TPA: hypothetical protein [Caudoviricetes sp.]